MPTSITGVPGQKCETSGDHCIITKREERVSNQDNIKKEIKEDKKAGTLVMMCSGSPSTLKQMRITSVPG